MLLLCWALLVAILVAPAGSVSCVDERGRSVDWWFALKHPRWTSKDHSVCIDNCSGTGYVYVTSESSLGTWQIGSAPITSNQSLLGMQLSAIYARKVGSYVFYNDQLPNGSWSSTYGHSKGFFAFDQSGAFWVQHSIPKFPNAVAGGYRYLEGETWFGQHAYCMSLTNDALNLAAGVMLYAYPQVYDWAIAGATLANVSAVIAGQRNATGTTVAVVPSVWGNLTLLGKSSAAFVDMADAVVAPSLHASMFSQSWLNSGGPIGGYCPATGFSVVDGLNLTVPAGLAGRETHQTYEDHAKWLVQNPARPSAGPGAAALGDAGGSSWWCALDNNHVASQRTRSGLAVCQQQPVIARLLQAAITVQGTCGGTPGLECCYFEYDSCHVGETCCREDGKPYVSETSCSLWGKKHRCSWTNNSCVVN
jgi:deoxyribonuclease II